MLGRRGYTHASAASTTYVVFEADDGFEANPRTLELGFEASFAKDGDCHGDCHGHGTCADGVCACDAGFGAGLGGASDCSVAVVELAPGAPKYVVNLDVGQWAYFSFAVDPSSKSYDASTEFLVEVVDGSAAAADPRLFAAATNLPTRSSYETTDWRDWFYDLSDVHYVSGAAGKGTYFVGVVNDPSRATEKFAGAVTLRVGTAADPPCLLDCGDHGTCSAGACLCEAGWTGARAGHPETCAFEVKDLQPGEDVTSSVRIGDWDIYKLAIAAADQSLLVEFYSASPESLPIALVRKGAPPALADGWLPGLDTFAYDAADSDGFTYFRGQRQSVRVSADELTAGDWYVGVYNLWGANLAAVSASTCDYSLKASLYNGGTPCPSTQAGGFCDGAAACDFNTGTCDCPPDRLWTDCSVAAATLVFGADKVAASVPQDGTAYYLLNATDDVLARRLNLDVRVTVTSGAAVVRAAYRELPFPGDLPRFSDHDLLANFYASDEHRILLDAEELQLARARAGPGYWYVGVANGGAETLAFAIAATAEARLDCPVARGSGAACDGAGVCDNALGRCDCDPGNVMDDCSGDGVFSLSGDGAPGVASKDYGNAPAIAADDWAFWSVVVGCDDRVLDVNLAFRDESARPKLVVRHGRLPLMVPDTYDYDDFYMDDGSRQRVVVAPCDDATYGCDGDCCINSASPGTAFATGAPEPGVYYVGVYNGLDAKTALVDYEITVSVDGATDCAECAPGFVGDACDVPCPGVSPRDVYSNSPVDHHHPKQAPCSGAGTCVVAGDPATDYKETVCECDHGVVGTYCEQACPAGDGGECSGRGTCVAQTATNAEAALCTCDDGWVGAACETGCPNSCSGHGACLGLASATAFADDGVAAAPKCDCDAGYVGDDCSFACPLTESEFSGAALCGDHGACVLVHGDDGAPTHAACECDAYFHGEGCDLSCPSADGAVCGGKGACVVADDGASVQCACDAGRAGDACESSTASSSKKGDGGLSIAAQTVIFLGVGFVLCVAAFAAWVAFKNQRKITNYERILRDCGVDYREHDGVRAEIELNNPLSLANPYSNPADSGMFRDDPDICNPFEEGQATVL